MSQRGIELNEERSVGGSGKGRERLVWERKDRVERGSKESTETAWEREKRSCWGWQRKSDGTRVAERQRGGGDRTETEDGGFVCRAQLRRAPCDERYTTRVRSLCFLEKERDHSSLLRYSFPPFFHDGYENSVGGCEEKLGKRIA